MDAKESTIITLDLSKELTPEELESFCEQAKKEDRSLEEHLRDIVLGTKQRQEKGTAA